jgi:hypothetical protein
MNSTGLLSKNVVSLVLVTGSFLPVSFSNNIFGLPITFFNLQIANLIAHYHWGFMIPKGEQKHEERESSEIGVLLESFWYKAVVGALFALFADGCII